MTLREFVGIDKIAANFVGQPTQAEWNQELTADDIAKLSDSTYLERIHEEHREMQAFMTARYGSSIYPPEKLAAKLGVPLLHVFGVYGIRGNKRLGTY